jgi:hypothetical protein
LLVGKSANFNILLSEHPGGAPHLSLRINITLDHVFLNDRKHHDGVIIDITSSYHDERPILAASLIPINLPAPSDGKYIGAIVGVMVGLVMGAVLLWIFIYWFHARYRDVNVCVCFGRSGRKKDTRQEGFTARSTKSYPIAEAEAAPANALMPLSWRYPQRVADSRQAGRLVCHGSSEKRSDSLETIEEN